MGDLAILLNTFHFGLVNTLLLLVLALIVKRKVCEHDAMYKWYIGKRAIEEKEKG